MKFIPQKYVLYVVIYIYGEKMLKNQHVVAIITQINVLGSKIKYVMLMY